MRKTIQEWQKEVHEVAVSKGWWESDRNVGEALALMHSELSEALEEYRAGHPLGVTRKADNGKPEGFLVELADVAIRVFDFCEAYSLDLEAAIAEKHAFNRTRPYRHGGKVA